MSTQPPNTHPVGNTSTAAAMAVAQPKPKSAAKANANPTTKQKMQMHRRSRTGKLQTFFYTMAFCVHPVFCVLLSHHFLSDVPN